MRNLGFHSGIADDSSVLSCYVLSNRKLLQSFRKFVLPLSSGSNSPTAHHKV